MSNDPVKQPASLQLSAARCETLIDYTFSNKLLLHEAITHASGANTRLRSNERMEFLGDAILGFFVCEHLFRRFPEWLEGELTRIKSVIVSRQTCSVWAEQLNLREVLIVGRGVAVNGDVPISLMADVFESILAAVYLDGGWEPTRKFLLPLVESQIDSLVLRNIESNYKSVLQQLVQREHGIAPAYLVLEETGPDHDKSFRISAQVGQRTFPSAWGKNKKEAEQRAAGNALAELGEATTIVAAAADAFVDNIDNSNGSEL